LEFAPLNGFTDFTVFALVVGLAWPQASVDPSDWILWLRHSTDAQGFQGIIIANV